MVSIQEMMKAERKKVNIYFTNGKIWPNKKCLFFEEAYDEDDESVLVFPGPDGNDYEVKQSDIAKIEIIG